MDLLTHETRLIVQHDQVGMSLSSRGRCANGACVAACASNLHEPGAGVQPGAVLLRAETIDGEVLHDFTRMPFSACKESFRDLKLAARQHPFQLVLGSPAPGPRSTSPCVQRESLSVSIPLLGTSETRLAESSPIVCSQQADAAVAADEPRRLSLPVASPGPPASAAAAELSAAVRAVQERVNSLGETIAASQAWTESAASAVQAAEADRAALQVEVSHARGLLNTYVYLHPAPIWSRDSSACMSSAKRCADGALQLRWGGMRGVARQASSLRPNFTSALHSPGRAFLECVAPLCLSVAGGAQGVLHCADVLPPPPGGHRAAPLFGEDGILMACMRELLHAWHGKLLVGASACFGHREADPLARFVPLHGPALHWDSTSGTVPVTAQGRLPGLLEAVQECHAAQPCQLALRLEPFPGSDGHFPPAQGGALVIAVTTSHVWAADTPAGALSQADLHWLRDSQRAFCEELIKSTTGGRAEGSTALHQKSSAQARRRSPCRCLVDASAGVLQSAPIVRQVWFCQQTVSFRGDASDVEWGAWGAAVSSAVACLGRSIAAVPLKFAPAGPALQVAWRHRQRELNAVAAPPGKAGQTGSVAKQSCSIVVDRARRAPASAVREHRDKLPASRLPHREPALLVGAPASLTASAASATPCIRGKLLDIDAALHSPRRRDISRGSAKPATPAARKTSALSPPRKAAYVSRHEPSSEVAPRGGSFAHLLAAYRQKYGDERCRKQLVGV